MDQNDRLTVNGLDANPREKIQSKGSIQLKFSFIPSLISESDFEHKFQIINVNDANLDYHGILGNDFFLTYKFLIDYDKEVVTNSSQSTYIYFKNPGNRIYLTPRSEGVIRVNIEDPHNLGQGLVDKFQIEPGVYVGDCMVSVNSEGQGLIAVMNATNCFKRYKMKAKLKLVPMHEDFMNTGTNKSFNSIRINKIKENLRTEHMTDEERNSIYQICEKFQSVFQLEGDTLTCTNITEHTIPIHDNVQPIHTKSYRYPEVHKDEVNTQITKMLEQGIIEPSQSPWSSPLWVVPKKTDASGKCKWRVVIDYRKLNAVTIGDSYPLPNITHILDQLGASSYFSVLDLASGFHQIPIKAEDKSKTAFSTPNGHYEFSRMPFGLRNAPAAFQRLMDVVLTGIQGIRCFVYLDDIVVYASSLQDHAERLSSVLSQLQKANLKIQPDKCEFLRKEVAYLGHVISDGGVKPDPKKIEVLQSYPIPKGPTDIKPFLGLVGYYRRFIPDFSKYSQVLTKLLKRDAEFLWGELEQKSFDHLKHCLMNEPILQYPDFNKQFILTTDASNFAIGAILSQGDVPNDLPIAYASRTLNRAESNYSTTERELLSIVWAVKHFRPYLYGRKFLNS